MVQRAPSQREPKRRPALGDRGDDDGQREQAHQDAGVEQHKAGAGIVDGAELELEPGADHEDAEREPDQPAPQFGIVEPEAEFGWSFIAFVCSERAVRIAPASSGEGCAAERGAVDRTQWQYGPGSAQRRLRIPARPGRREHQFVFFASPSVSITLRSDSVTSTTNFL